MQKIKDKSKKIKVQHLQTIFYILFERLIPIIILRMGLKPFVNSLISFVFFEA